MRLEHTGRLFVGSCSTTELPVQVDRFILNTQTTIARCWISTTLYVYPSTWSVTYYDNVVIMPTIFVLYFAFTNTSLSIQIVRERGQTSTFDFNKWQMLHGLTKRDCGLSAIRISWSIKSIWNPFKFQNRLKKVIPIHLRNFLKKVE